MSTSEILTLLSIIVSGSLNIALATYAWLRRDVRGAEAFAAMMVLSCWLSLAVLARALSPTAAAAHTWFRLSVFAVAFAPVAWLVFALHYAESAAWLTVERMTWFLIIPVLTQAAIWTNGFHHLWTSEPVGFIRENILWKPVTMGAQYGAWFWVHTVYSYGLMVIACVIMVRQALKRRHVYRVQAIEVLIGVALPVLGSAIFVFRLLPTIDLPFMMVGLALGGWPLYRALFEHKLLDIVPVARDTLVESMEDGLLVLDLHDRIVDLNTSMAALLHTSPHQVIGRRVAEVLGRPSNPEPEAGDTRSPASERTARTNTGAWPALLAQISSGAKRAEVGHVSPSGYPNDYFDVRITELSDPQGLKLGRLVVLRDISERRRAEMALRQANRDLQRRNEELDIFALTAAHDLKDPLATIMGYASILKSQAGQEEKEPKSALIQEIPDIIWETGVEMSNVINALSLLAGVPREAIELEPLDMASLVASAEQRLVRVISDHNAKIIHPKRWPSAVGYGPWIGEVWINFLRNAIRLGEYPPTVEIGGTEQGNGTVRFWVRQEQPTAGAEPPCDTLEEFTWMGQIGPRRHRLGNTIVRRIMERLGGEAGIRTHDDGTTVFYFTLPKLDH